MLKYKEVEEVQLIEIDEELSMLFGILSRLAGVFDDPRFKLIVDDGIEFVKSKQTNDVIIVDSSIRGTGCKSV